MGNTQKITVAGVVFYVLVRSLNVWSADTGNPTVDPGMPTTLPPTFDASIAQQMAATMNSCMSFEQPFQQLGNALQGLGGVPAAGGKCGPDDASISNVHCDGSVESYSAMVKKKIDVLKQVEKNIACKQAGFDGLFNEIKCLQNQTNALSAQVTSLQKSFQDNIHRMESDVSQIKSVQEDRRTQFEDVSNKLGGDKSTGTPGLMRLRDETSKAVTQAMPQTILAIKEGFNQIAQFRKGLEEQIATRMISQTNDCFNNRASSGFRCTPNGPPVSTREYVLCRYEQNQQLGANGVIERNQLVVNQAKANSAALAAVLNSILSDSGRSVVVDPNNPGAAAAAMNQSVTVMTPDDIESQYGSQLSGYNGKGLNIHDFVMAEIKACYSRAKSVVARERNMASSPIGTATETMNKQQRSTQDMVNTFIETYGQMFAQNMAGLTGTHMPLNTSACTNASPDVQTGCLNDLLKNMQGLLNGNVTQSQMNIQIKGTNAQTYIPISCQGLVGCVTVLQTVSNNVQREIKRLDQFKKDYVLKARQNVDQFAITMANTLSPQSQALTQRLQAMAGRMAQLGVNWTPPGKLQSEPLELNEDGLPKPPKNALAFIGSKMNPPMLEMGSDGLGAGLNSLADGKKELDRKLAKVTQGESELEAQKNACIADIKERQDDKVASVLSNFQECVKAYDYCSQVSGGYYDQMQELINKATGYEFGDLNVKESLERGTNECRNRMGTGEGGAGAEGLKKDIITLAAELEKLGENDGATKNKDRIDLKTKLLTEKRTQLEKLFQSTNRPCGSPGSVIQTVNKAFKVRGSAGDGSGHGVGQAE